MDIINDAMLNNWFQSAACPEDCPPFCEHLQVIPDIYATGDSPDGYKCNCEHARECPVVRELMDDYSKDQDFNT